MAESKKPIRKIKIGIIGAGGGGTNAIANNAHKFVPFDVSFLAINTDIQALEKQKKGSKRDNSKFFERKLIGRRLTRGLGAGSNPDIGWKAAAEDREWIEKWLSDKKLVFIATGMGGGSGTGAGPYIARLAKNMGILTIGVSTLPFLFEGKERMDNALTGLKTMEKYADLSIVINNNDLFKKHSSDTVEHTFAKADKYLGDGIITVLNLLLEDALINLDLADIRKVVKDSGGGFINIAFAKGIDESGLDSNKEKFEKAISSLFDLTFIPSDVKTATKALLSISGSPNILKMEYVRFIVNKILATVSHDLDIIFGVTNNPALEDNVKISLILTGMDKIVLTDDVKDIEEKYFAN